MMIGLIDLQPVFINESIAWVKNTHWTLNKEKKKGKKMVLRNSGPL